MKKKNITIDQIIDFIGCVGFVLLLLLSLSNVFTNWIFKKRFGQIEELVQMLFVWSVYTGAGLLYKKKEHMTVTFIYDMFPKGGQKVLSVLIDIITLCTSLFVSFYAIKLTIKSITKVTPVMHIPYCYIDLAVVIGFVTLSAFAIAKLISTSRKVENKEEEK